MEEIEARVSVSKANCSIVIAMPRLLFWTHSSNFKFHTNLPALLCTKLCMVKLLDFRFYSGRIFESVLHQP